jgi:hypothetical protein
VLGSIALHVPSPPLEEGLNVSVLRLRRKDELQIFESARLVAIDLA